jgi:hypothetical protein
MIDYRQNIESISDLSDKEKQFLIAYFCDSNQQLKKLYRYDSCNYNYWYRWLKQHQYILYKIVNFSKVDLIKNSADAFNFVLNHCIDIVHNCSNKQNKTKIKALEVIQKICGLESYAQQTIANLNQASKQSDLTKLTTQQLQQLANSVSCNLALLEQSKTKYAERESCDEQEQDVSDTQQAIIIDELNRN